jgi:hypothetical protein
MIGISHCCYFLTAVSYLYMSIVVINVGSTHTLRQGEVECIRERVGFVRALEGREATVCVYLIFPLVG